jgi:glycosyltransferase involved in cell wall biosynthesis
MATLNSILYISSGKLPSKWAHSVQMAKMAQAFSEKVEKFELVTSGDIWSYLTGKNLNLKDWYGLHHEFKVVRLPMHLKLTYPFSREYFSNRNFNRLAAVYAFLKSPSLVYTRYPGMALLLLRFNLPVVVEMHNPIEKNSCLVKKLLFNKNFLGVVALSQEMANSFVNQGMPSKKVLTEYNAVDLQRFFPYQTKDSARETVALPKNKPIAVYAGHLYDYKGIPTVLDLARVTPECDFALVGGWSDDVERVKETCKQMGLRNVRVIGHVTQPQLPSYLYAADLLLLPTSKQWETSEVTSPLNLKLFEYMASQRPIVASALPNIVTMLQHETNALLAEPDNSVSFKEAVERLLKNPSLGDAIAEHAFQDVQNYTWENRAARIIQFATDRLAS